MHTPTSGVVKPAADGEGRALRTCPVGPWAGTTPHVCGAPLQARAPQYRALEQPSSISKPTSSEAGLPALAP